MTISTQSGIICTEYDKNPFDSPRAGQDYETFRSCIPHGGIVADLADDKVFFYVFYGVKKMIVKAKLMDEGAVRRTWVRMAHEIVEKNDTADELCFLGIHRRGVPLARALAENVTEFSGISTYVGTVDVTPHRDDRDRDSKEPAVTKTKIDFSLDGKTVILVDDVIYTGRTIRAAMEALMTLGRPAKIQLAVLVDRGHRELPIRGDYVGKNVPTSRKERISVRVTEFDGETGVYVCEPEKN